MSNPIQSLERIIKESLVARGMTEAEAANAIQKIKSAGQHRAESPSQRRTEPQGDVTFECDVIRRSASDLAIQVMINGQAVWLPFSQLKDGSNPYGGLITIPRWLAIKEGLVVS